MAAQTLNVHLKIWLADPEGRVVFGDGRMRLLEAIDRTGSILQAAEMMGMSYRSAWGRLKQTAERWGTPLIEPMPGAGRRGGSRLTAEGRRLLNQYKELVKRLDQAAQATFGQLFVIDD